MRTYQIGIRTYQKVVWSAVSTTLANTHESAQWYVLRPLGAWRALRARVLCELGVLT